MRARAGALAVVALCCGGLNCLTMGNPDQERGEVRPVTLHIRSTVDGTIQPSLLIPAQGTRPRPLLVLLHPWSHGFNTYDLSDWHAEAAKRNWHVVQPHFRGPNNQPEACASTEARQDILDAVDHVCGSCAVDETRIYLAGASGGGHMAMVMAAHAPHRWTAVSAWCGISDLDTWWRECRDAGRKYAGDIEACVGGPPGSSPEVDRQVHYRSPVHHLAKAGDVPIDLSTGIHDGHTGSVPIHHTLDAFNALAQACGAEPVTAEEIRALADERPLAVSQEQDPTYGRAIHLRRHAGPSRVTIFEGGHEGLAEPACAWLATHPRNP